MEPTKLSKEISNDLYDKKEYTGKHEVSFEGYSENEQKEETIAESIESSDLSIIDDNGYV